MSAEAKGLEPQPNDTPSEGKAPKAAFDLREFLFRHRDHVPIPFAVATLAGMWFYHPDFAAGRPWVAWASGALAVVCIAAGEALRIWSVGHSGRTTRAKSLKAPALATGGPYAVVRNPIYVGNFLLGLGYVLLTRIGWVAGAYVLFFFAQYSLIVSIEEEFLEGKFGDDYREYKKRVRRFLPNLARLGAKGSEGEAFRWSALGGEKWTLANMAACGVLVLFVMSWLRTGRLPLFQ